MKRLMYWIKKSLNWNWKYNKNIDAVNGYIDNKKASEGFISWFKGDFIKRNTI